MGEFVTDLLNFVDYQAVLTVVVFYLVAMWLMFCLWVFVDAKKRYGNVLVALLLAALVFIFTFPALIFYLIIRPEEHLIEDHSIYYSEQGGVNVPVVNFVGSDGEVQMSINLQVYKQPYPNADMKVQVDWQSSQDKMQVSKALDVAEKGGVVEAKSQGRFARLSERAKSRLFRAVDASKSQMESYNSELSASTEARSGDGDLAEAKNDKSKGKKKK